MSGRVLVVDDERSIVDFIRLGMRYEGFRVEDFAARVREFAILELVRVKRMHERPQAALFPSSSHEVRIGHSCAPAPNANPE